MVEFEGVKFDFDITDADTFDAVSDFDKEWKSALRALFRGGLARANVLLVISFRIK